MSLVRKPAVAGTFYPADASELTRMLDDLLDHAPKSQSKQPKAVIAPHAGYIYSGPTAATAYATIAQWADSYCRVVLLGPSHRVGFRGIASTSAEEFITPIGSIEIDREALAELEESGEVRLLDQAHLHEHSLEVHLPFLLRTLNDFQLIPLVVGDASPYEVAGVIDSLWGGDETLIVISSDLSHYLTYDQAQERDRFTSTAIEQLDSSLIRSEDACGSRAIQGLLLAARQNHLRCKLIDLRNSGDTAGDRNRVVGYGSYLFH